MPSEPCPLASTNAKDDSLLKMAFWISPASAVMFEAVVSDFVSIYLVFAPEFRVPKVLKSAVLTELFISI